MFTGGWAKRGHQLTSLATAAAAAACCVRCLAARKPCDCAQPCVAALGWAAVVSELCGCLVCRQKWRAVLSLAALLSLLLHAAQPRMCFAWPVSARGCNRPVCWAVRPTAREWCGSSPQERFGTAAPLGVEMDSTSSVSLTHCSRARRRSQRARMCVQMCVSICVHACACACWRDPTPSVPALPAGKLIHNFVYRPDLATNRSICLVARDIHHAASVSRRFYWSVLNLWPHQLPRNTMVVLSGRDELVPVPVSSLGPRLACGRTSCRATHWWCCQASASWCMCWQASVQFLVL